MTSRTGRASGRCTWGVCARWRRCQCHSSLMCFPEIESLPGPVDREHLCGSGSLRGHDSIELPSVLGAVQGSSLRAAHARGRARPSGLDGTCAQLTGRQLRDGLYVRLERTRGDACVRKSPAGAFIGLEGTTSATA